MQGYFVNPNKSNGFLIIVTIRYPFKKQNFVLEQPLMYVFVYLCA
jgi:hypothetical protein